MEPGHMCVAELDEWIGNALVPNFLDGVDVRLQLVGSEIVDRLSDAHVCRDRAGNHHAQRCDDGERTADDAHVHLPRGSAFDPRRCCNHYYILYHITTKSRLQSRRSVSAEIRCQSLQRRSQRTAVSPEQMNVTHAKPICFSTECVNCPFSIATGTWLPLLKSALIVAFSPFSGNSISSRAVSPATVTGWSCLARPKSFLVVTPVPSNTLRPSTLTTTRSFLKPSVK